MQGMMVTSGCPGERAKENKGSSGEVDRFGAVVCNLVQQILSNCLGVAQEPPSR